MSSTERDKILAEVEALLPDMTRFLQELIRVPSLPGTKEEGTAQSLVAAALADEGIPVEVYEPDIELLRQHHAYSRTEDSFAGRPNVVATIEATGSGPGRSLILNGHIDVVPVDDEEYWKHDPWGAVVDEGRIYGRGAEDMKGGLVAQMVAFVAVKRSGVRLNQAVTFESVVEEEVGGNGALAAALRGPSAEAAIIAEPTALSITEISNRGAQYFRLTIQGEEIPIEWRWARPHPIDKALAVYEAVNHFSLLRESQAQRLDAAELYRYRPGTSPDARIDRVLSEQNSTIVPTSVCMFNGGRWPSSIPGKVVLEGSLECLPGEDIEAVKKDFASFIQELHKSDAWFSDHPPQLEWFGLYYEPGLTPADHPIVEQIQRSTMRIAQQPVIPVGGVGSDLRCFNLYRNTPAVCFGPGYGTFHGRDEYVSVEEFGHAARIYADIIADWCGVSGGK